MTLWQMARLILRIVESLARRFGAIENQLQKIQDKQAEQDVVLKQILTAVTPHPAKALVLTLGKPIQQ